MNYLTKWPEAKVISNATAEETEKFIYEDIICWYRYSQIILSNKGTHFNNQVIKKLVDRFQIKYLLSILYYSQTNGLVEQFNCTLYESLAKLLNKSTEWDKLISSVLFTYRTSKYFTIKTTPFYLIYRRDITLPMDKPIPKQEDLSNRLIQLIDELP